jgi:hypothetical protein
MPYITSVEEIGYERGVQEEAQRSKEREKAREKALILRQLHRKVGEIPDRSLTRIQALSIDQLEALGEALLDLEEIADLTTWLDHC